MSAVSATSRRAIEQFLTLLRDCNLKVGSSVRAIAECAAGGTTDLTIIITMSESRLLSRVPKLFAKMKAAIRPEQYHRWYLFGDLKTAIGIMCSYRFVSYCQKLKIC